MRVFPRSPSLRHFLHRMYLHSNLERICLRLPWNPNLERYCLHEPELSSRKHELERYLLYLPVYTQLLLQWSSMYYLSWRHGL